MLVLDDVTSNAQPQSCSLSNGLCREEILKKPLFYILGHTFTVDILAFEGDGQVFYFEGNYSDYEANKAQRLGLDEPKRQRYRKLMEE